MKHLKRFNESLEKSFPGEISISDFIDRLNEGRTPPLGASKETIISWWNQNRSNFKIHYFPFNTQKPIMGCFVGTDRVLINSTPPVPGDIKFFIALHESRHAFQEENSEFTPKYFQTVVDGNKEEFLQNYKELEQDANTYAIDACRTMGFRQIISMEHMLRGNENMGEEIYRMMTDDLAKTNASTFFELLEGQIL